APASSYYYSLSLHDALPIFIILASFIYPLMTFDIKEVQNFNMAAILSGMTTAFIIGYICIKYFMKFLEKSTLKGFAYYCWIAGRSEEHTSELQSRFDLLCRL